MKQEKDRKGTQVKKGNILFFFFIILAIVSLFINLIKYNSYFYINYFANTFSTLTFNLEMPKTTDLDKVFVYYNDCEKVNFQNDLFPIQTLAPQNDIYSIAVINSPNITDLELYVDKDIQSDIKKLVIYNNAKEYYYPDIFSFEHETKEYCESEDNCKTFEAYRIPKDIQVIKGNEAYNYRGISHDLMLSTLSILYNPNFFLLFYLFLACAYAVTKIKRLEFDLKLPCSLEKFALPALLIFGTWLRLVDIDLYPLWDDEMAGMIFTRTGILSDKGTLPSIVLFIKIWKGIFGNSFFALRILPVIFSVWSIYGIYAFVKQATKSKMFTYTATILYTVNIFAIYLSQELRSYSLSMLITAMLGLYLFRLIEKYSLKDLIWYVFWTVLSLNTHYYLILLSAFNFIYYIYKKKDNKSEIKNFVIGHFIAGLCFIPALWSIVGAAWTDTTFNTWIPSPSLHYLKESAIYFFGNTNVFWGVVLFVLVYYLIYFIRPKVLEYLPDEDKKLFNYSVATLIFIMVFSLIISLKRPIFYNKYFMCVLPLFIVVYSMFLNVFFKTKYWFTHILAVGTIVIMSSCFIPEVARAAYFQDGVSKIATYENLEDANNGMKIAVLEPDRYITKEEADYIRDEFDYFIYIWPETVTTHIYKHLDDENYDVIYTNSLEPEEFEGFMEEANKKYKDIRLFYNGFYDRYIVKVSK